MPSVNRQAFVAQHAQQRLDLDRVAQDPSAAKTLADAGLSVDLVQAAGSAGVLDASSAFELVKGLPAAKQGAAAEALARLLDTPSLQAIDRPNSVFGAMLRAKVDVTGASPSGTSELKYVSASSVEDAGGLGSEAWQAMGSFGPLAAYGPLSELGAIGDNWWNPSRVIDSANGSFGANWTGTKDGEPLSSAGPLGEHGPLSEVYFDGALFDPESLASGLTNELRGLGQASVLGPLGPLGPLGALGPLGPVGAHGFATDDQGSFVSSDGQVQRTIDVWYDDAKTTKNTFELYERYSADFAKQMTDNDTSFMVDGRLSYARGDPESANGYSTDTFSFTSQSDQLVTIALVPEKQLDDFDFEVLDDKGKVLLKSDSDDLIDWAQLEVKKGTKLSVRVKLKESHHWLAKDYRLFVTGSGERFKDPMSDGDHVRAQGETG